MRQVLLAVIAGSLSVLAQPLPRSEAAGFALPQEFPIWPSSPVIDLGPVVIPMGTKESDAMHTLIALSNRFGADGFVEEKVTPDVIYGGPPAAVRDARLATPRHDADDVDMNDTDERRELAQNRMPGVMPIRMYKGAPDFSQEGARPPLAGNRASRDRFFRLFRRDKHTAAAKSLPNVQLPTETRALLAAQTTLREQFQILNYLAFSGEINESAYTSIREAWRS